jgi:hypothetical protein
MSETPDLETLRQRIVDGDLDDVRSRLATHATEDHDAHGSCLDLGGILEDAGLFELARAEYEAAWNRDRNDSRALLLLVDLLDARGDHEDRLRHLMDAFDRSPADGEILSRVVPELRARSLIRRVEQVLARAEEAGADPELLTSLREGMASAEDVPAALPPDSDLVRFLDLFGGREDVHARQWHDPPRGTGYTPVHQPLSLHLLRNHLLGNVTLGVYPIRLDGRVGFFALDIDLDRGVLERHRADGDALVAFRETLHSETALWLGRLREFGFDPIIEDSGYKGRHLWVLLQVPVEAARIHELGRRMLAAFPAPRYPVSLEFFPKQGRTTGKGLGNLIKLPLGIHRRTGRRADLLGAEGEVILEPWKQIRSAGLVSTEGIDAVMAALEGLAPSMEVDARRVEAPGAPEEEAPSDIRLGPPPVCRRPVWTEAQFETDPEIRHLLAHCPVLAALAERVDRGEGLDYDEQIVVRHTLGHLPQGIHAANHLLARCPQVRPEMPLKSKLGSSPISCPRIRSRLPRLTRTVPCRCKFPFAPESYPTPLLHLRTLEPEDASDGESPAEQAERLARTYSALNRRTGGIEREQRAVEAALRKHIGTLPDRCLVLPEGVYRLVERDGGEADLVWEPSEEAGKALQTGEGEDSA